MLPLMNNTFANAHARDFTTRGVDFQKCIVLYIYVSSFRLDKKVCYNQNLILMFVKLGGAYYLWKPMLF